MYQVADQFSEPFTLLWVLSVLAVAVLWWRQRWRLGQALPLVVGIVGLGLVSTPPVAAWAIGTLERQYPPVAPGAVDADAIVVLSGSVLEGDGQLVRPTLGASSLVRTRHAARLYHAGPARPIIVTGRDPTRPPLVAPLMAVFLVELGVPTDDIMIEDQATTTAEHAREVGPLLRARGLTRPALVTEASHLPRAVRVFEAHGIAVVPAGCHYRGVTPGEGWRRFVPSARGAALLQVVAHEWIGTVWYGLRGHFTPVDPMPDRAPGR